MPDRPSVAIDGNRLAVGTPRPNPSTDGTLHLVGTEDGGDRQLVRYDAGFPPREFGRNVVCNSGCSLVGVTFTQVDGGGVEIRDPSTGALRATLPRRIGPSTCGKSVSLASQALVAATGCGEMLDGYCSEIAVLRPDGGLTSWFGHTFAEDVAFSASGDFLAGVGCHTDGGFCRVTVLGDVLRSIVSPVYRSLELPAADSLRYYNVELSESGSVLAVSNPRWFGGYGGLKVFTFSGSTFDLQAEIDGGVANDELGFGLAMAANANVIVVTRLRGLSAFVYDRFSDGGLCLSQTLPAASLVRGDVSISRDGRTIALVALDGGLQVYQRP
ncbi:MAG: hypothetical protein JNJ54_00415 [Myxococcaceae bacterium]|nr:hypothetical protein [Myxococcaceae bacterium]